MSGDMPQGHADWVVPTDGDIPELQKFGMRSAQLIAGPRAHECLQ